MHRLSRSALPIAAAAVAVLLSGCGTQPAPGDGAGTTPTAPPAAPSAGPPPAGAQPSTAGQPAGETVRLSYSGQQAGGDTGRAEVPLGSTVSLVVSGDTADEVHLHGYDRYFDVPAGGSATLTFTADIPGVFEVELHDQGLLLTQLQVTPR